MKKLITALLMAVAIAATAANYTVTWTGSAGATGYKVYSSTNGTTWKLERGVSGTSVTLSNIPLTVVSFAVSATNNVGSESLKAVADILLPVDGLRIIATE